MSKKSKFEDELFGDLDLKPEAYQPPEPPALTQVPGFDTLNVANLSVLEEKQKLSTTSAIKSPLKKPPPRGPSPVVLGGIVVAILLLGGVGLMFVMGWGPFGLSQSTIPKIQRTAPRIKKGRQLLHIATQPKDAVVWINGKPYPSKTPVDLVLLPYRTYKLAVKLPGYEDALKTLVLQAAQKPIRLDFVLKKLQETPKPPELRQPDLADLKHGEGYIQVVCEPLGATVVIGKRPGIKCPATIQIEGGTHPIVVEKEGYESYSGGVTVQAAQVITFPIKLNPLSPSMLRKMAVAKRTQDRNGPGPRRTTKRGPRGKGSVTIACQPAATVYWNRKKMGVTPVTFSLPAGRQELILKGSQGAQRMVTVTVKPNKTIAKQLTFRFGSIKFKVQPWADVWINGKKIGQTPIPPYKAREGIYTVVLRNGTNSKQKRVTVTGNEVTHVFDFFP